jgi:hypothetical protein
MIVHYKEPIQNMQFCLKTPLQFSKDFTFIPIQFKGNKECIFQSPKMYVPFSKQINHNDKEYMMVSFQNKTNDLQTDKFLDDLNYIYDLINFEYLETHNVNHFIKENNGNHTMNIKLRDNMPTFDTLKNPLDDIPLYSYASFIIHLVGLWVTEDQIWFQWYALQGRVENNVVLNEYAFVDTIKKPIPPPPPPPPPPPNFGKDKYKKMITLGMPTANENQVTLKSTISSDMLQSVKLKKTELKKPELKSDMNGFEAPSLDSLQLALQRLRRIINPE